MLRSRNNVSAFVTYLEALISNPAPLCLDIVSNPLPSSAAQCAALCGGFTLILPM